MKLLDTGQGHEAARHRTGPWNCWTHDRAMKLLDTWQGNETARCMTGPWNCWTQDRAMKLLQGHETARNMTGQWNFWTHDRAMKLLDTWQGHTESSALRGWSLWKETGMQKWARLLMETDKAFADPSATTTQSWEDSRLLEFSTFNNLVLMNTFGCHKAFRAWSWQSSSRQHHNQMDYI